MYVRAMPMIVYSPKCLTFCPYGHRAFFETGPTARNHDELIKKLAVFSDYDRIMAPRQLPMLY